MGISVSAPKQERCERWWPSKESRRGRRVSHSTSTTRGTTYAKLASSRCVVTNNVNACTKFSRNAQQTPRSICCSGSETFVIINVFPIYPTNLVYFMNAILLLGTGRRLPRYSGPKLFLSANEIHFRCEFFGLQYPKKTHKTDPDINIWMTPARLVTCIY